MISEILLKFGRVPGGSPQRLGTSPVTVFVGPNNSGKSRVLFEIAQYCQTGRKNSLAVILEDVTFRGLEADLIDSAIQKVRHKPAPNESVAVGHIILGSKMGRDQVSHQELKAFMANPESNRVAFCQWFLKHRTLILDGQNRIGLVSPQPAGDLQASPQSSLQVLFRDDAKRKEVRRIIEEAFGSYFIIDPTQLGQLRIRLSSKPPESDIQERGLHQEAVEFHGQAQRIEEASDGVRAFTGILTEVFAGDPAVLLIDEPEAFLHPSLAQKLGLELSLAAKKTGKNVFISTHSSQFLMGCIHSDAPVDIIRLTFRAGVPTARLIQNAEVLELMRNPLLRSTGVLSGLFYEFVVVTESDADRAFYQEINERLLRFEPKSGIPNCLFLNAQNKQTVHTIIRPLRSLGIPTAGIVDIDVLKEGGEVWAKFLSSANVPEALRTSTGHLRQSIKAAMESTKLDMKKHGGIGILEKHDREAAQSLLYQLNEYGLFVVPGGELEFWLKNLKAAGHGPNWLIDIFGKMGNDPEAAEYVKPTEGDVWQFMGLVKAWLADPNRKGIPD